jgi:hypothetical protein
MRKQTAEVPIEIDLFVNTLQKNKEKTNIIFS